MAGQYVNLRFEYKKYGEDEDSPEQTISFEGHNGWQMMQFHKQPPTEKQVRLLAELARILNELASDEELDTPISRLARTKYDPVRGWYTEPVTYQQKPVEEWILKEGGQ